MFFVTCLTFSFDMLLTFFLIFFDIVMTIVLIFVISFDMAVSRLFL